MADLSVVIPVYNVENYLENCVTSVLHESTIDIEVILVDDGSSDNSGRLCDEIVKRSNKVRVLHKQNEGPGSARNSGIDLANGKYITFVDSDDYISAGYYQNIFQQTEKAAADICFSIGINQFGGALSRNIRLDYLEDLILDNNEKCVKALSRMISDSPRKHDGIPASACLGIYRLDFIKRNNLRFRECISEDLWFNMDCYYKANRICFSNIVGYNYRYNNQSLTRSYKPDRFEKLVSFVKDLKKRCEEYGCTDYYERIYIYYWLNFEKCINQEVRYKTELPFINIKAMCELPLTESMFHTLKSTGYPRGMHRLLFNLLCYKKYRTTVILLKAYNAFIHKEIWHRYTKEML